MENKNTNIKGIGFLILTLLLFSLQNIIIKWIGGDYSIMQIIFFRSLLSVPCTLILFRFEGARGFPTSKQFWLEIARGFLLFLSHTAHLMGLASLTLAAAESIRYSAPLMITLLSVFILREKVDWRRWFMLVLGFIGVLIVVKPGSSAFDLGSIFMLAHVVLYSLAIIITRKLKLTESGATMAFYSSLVYFAASLILVPLISVIGEFPDAHASIAFLFRAWATPTLLDGIVMTGLGLIWASAFFSLARAYSLAKTSLVAQFEYLSLPINIVWELIIWQEIPTLLTLVGAAITLLCGLYVISLERKGTPE